MRHIRTLLAAAALLSVAASAQAADLYPGSTKDAPASSYTANTWTGFYVGAGVTGNFVDHVLSNPSGSTVFDGLAAQGVGGSFFGGVNYQVQRIVFGVEGNFDLSNADTSLIASDDEVRLALNHTWGVTARGGVLATPQTLIYGKVGYGGAEFEAKGTIVSTKNATTYSSEGMIAGGGIETRIWENFTIRAEYSWLGLDSKTIEDAAKFDTDIQTVKLGVSYLIPVKTPLN
jgi:outer membrane immunogenic protein